MSQDVSSFTFAQQQHQLQTIILLHRGP